MYMTAKSYTLIQDHLPEMISYLKNKRITVVTTNAMVVPSILEKIFM